jgi:hypothetical protein
MNSSIEALRLVVSGAHNKMPFAHRLHRVIVIAAEIPEAGITIGIVESISMPQAFLIQSARLSTFLGLKPNSLLRNLRDFGFKRLEGLDQKIEIETHLGSQTTEWRKWSIWRNMVGNFNKTTTDVELDVFSVYARNQRYKHNQAPGSTTLTASSTDSTTSSSISVSTLDSMSISSSPSPFMDDNENGNSIWDWFFSFD